MDDFNDKIDSYQLILEIEDWLGIKHNPQILKECWDVMNDYYCDLQQMRDEIIYSELEDYNMVDEDALLKEAALTTCVEHIDDLEKKRQIEEAYKELESVDESIRKQHQTLMEFDSNSEFIQKVEDDLLYEKLPLYRKIQEKENEIGLEHKPGVLEMSEDEMWKYYLELMDLPDALQRNKGNDGTSFVENKRSLIDYSGDDLSLDPNMW